ncbi:ATP-dependent DNA helicase Q4 [Formica exsecta]|uniref:ATP-dependent DNA helicase Q4 n=1 Tax=Formica exsecta TaxID=72781 RepID=UPI001143F31E|nr:ATP-dependent DNA helicase Q4 [Formica exsecta]
MKLFEDPVFKTKYMKNKLRVKRWESDFMEKYGRKPNKNDIKEADISIKEAYKVYWKLKTSALEETLTDITFCDDMQDNVTNNLLQKSINDQDKIPSPEKISKDTENINPHDSKCFTETESSLNQLSTSTNVEGVWGDNLNKSKEQMPKRKQALLIGRTSSFQLSKNKFESSTFTKRNPRKSLSSTKIRDKCENTSSSIDQTVASGKDDFDTTANEVKPMFGESMKLTFEENKPVVQYSINAVQQLADGHVTCVSRNLNEGWLDRCTKESNYNMETINAERFSGTSDSGVESTESSIHSPKSSIASATILQVSDEDFICNSDSEEECRKKRIRNFKKQLSNQDDGRPTKRQCVKMDFDSAITSKASTKLTAMEKLEKKMDTGTMNNNFVRINLKKKVFVRGKKNFNLFKYKRNQWKQRKKLASSESSLDAADLIDKNGITCFKCGESGHFAKRCTTFRDAALLPLNEIDESTNFPTLEEAEKMASKNAQVVARSHRIDRLPEGSSAAKISCSQDEEEKEDMAKLFDDDFADVNEKDTLIFQHKIPQELLSRLLPPQREVVDPVYSANEDGSLIKTPTEVVEALRMFGHENFRSGQEKAIMRILSGQSTLVMLSTGSGKSLCYQLPAYLYSQHSHCITLVISPLVSLMDDQVMGMPKVLSAACLHTNQTPKVREQVMQSVRDGKVNILLVSPEAVVADEKSTGFGALLRQLPPIAFACIDEVHCISQWSHNFRPSYLMVCRVLKEKLHVKTILGLTATVTKTTAKSIVKHLDLHDSMAGVISDVPLPRNLVLTVSKDENKDHALIALLKSDRFRELDCVIVYCIRREECERIAALLRVSLQDPRNPGKPKAKISMIAEAYHAGMTAHKRKIVQKEFMSGKIKIVVATVAFGMGINKLDIRAIIHYNMPGTFEGYVQEIGRSGRDSITAHCHLFLNPTKNSDKWELRKHIHANGVDRHTIRHLLQRIFIPCSCKKIKGKDSDWKCPGHEVALPIDEIVQDLDITQETISTLLCYLELHSKRFITVLSSVYVRARVSSYNGPQALKRAAQSSPPLAMAIALDMQKGISHKDSNIIEFSVIDIASTIGWDSGVVKSHLKTLEWTTGADGKTKRSAISVQYDKLGLRVKAPGDLTDTELDEALDALIDRTRSQESSCLQQLELISLAFDKISVPTIKDCLILDDDVMKRAEELKNIIREYFQSDSPLNNVDTDFQDKVANEEHIAADVRNLIIRYRDTKFTGRAVARIFHGIQSPNYPALIWSKCSFWRVHIAADFNVICKIATREILALR